jgi:predicted DNA-binding transcriptional regulator AlpA
LVNNTDISQDLTNALLFRLHRQSLYPNNNEDAFERLEGLAEYTGFKLATIDSCLKTNELIKHIDTGIKKVGFSNSFAYFTGPAYGFIFDKYSSDWIEQVKQGLSLTQIGCKLVNFNPSYIDTVKIEFLVKQYKADSLINAVKSRAEKEKQLVEKLERKFFNNSRLVIPYNNINFTFNPQEKLVSISEGVVYPTFSLTANWGTLKVSKGIYRDNNWRFFIVPIPDSIISGVGDNKYMWDGYELMLKSGYFIQEIEDRKFQIADKHKYSN